MEEFDDGIWSSLVQEVAVKAKGDSTCLCVTIKLSGTKSLHRKERTSCNK